MLKTNFMMQIVGDVEIVLVLMKNWSIQTECEIVCFHMNINKIMVFWMAIDTEVNMQVIDCYN